MRMNKLVLIAAAATAVLGMVPVGARAADVIWNNGGGDFLWNTTSPNWSTGAWNNAAGDGAIFDAVGAGSISLPGSINANSLNFLVNGYTLNGTGSINMVDGTSTQTTGVIRVGPGNTAQINVPVNSSLGFQKIGAGVLELSAPGSFTGEVPLDGRGNTTASLLVGGSFGTLDGGTLRVSPGVIPASTNVSIGQGYLDIGSNNLTLNNLTFTNQNPDKPWNTTLNANNGVVGSGTLRVTGEINVLGAFGDNFGNSIAANLDLGGGQQIVRIGNANSSALNRTLMFTGVLSNGSLLKTWGYNPNGVLTGNGTDGISLFANNTFTGPLVLNAGNNVITGTNATTTVKIVGSAGLNGNSVVFQGANGSAQSATLLQATEGGAIILDNNVAAGVAGGNNSPFVPAAQNNDRIRDDASVELRYGTLTYRGLLNTAASETFGNLSILGGHNIINLTANGSLGTQVVTVAGNLTMAPRSTMFVNSGSLSGAAKIFVNGSLPTADATGILPLMVGTTSFLTYDGATGLTPLATASYATDFSTAGTNVSIAAATTIASSVNINALRTTNGSAATLTIAAGQTLGIDSGMILTTGFGNTVFTGGGTLAFGDKPGVLFGTGAIVLGGNVSGSAGMILAKGTGTFSGDFSGLSGPIDILSGTANVNSNTLLSPINLRNGALNLNVSQTAPGMGPITIGTPGNPDNLFGNFPSLSVSNAGANAVFNRDIIVDNSTTNLGGVTLRYSLAPGIAVLSNTTGTQTFNGNITLNTPLRIQGGGASATSTGATVFAGNITGPSTFHVPNGRVIFTGNYSNAGGFNLGDQGFSMKASFLGTGAGNGSVVISGGNGNTVSYEDGALPGGPIVIRNSSPGTAPQLIPLDDSTINNQIILGPSLQTGEEGDVIANVGTGIKATWAGVVSGANSLNKTGPGTLVLSNAGNTHTGSITVTAGTLTAKRLVGNASVDIAADATLRIGPDGAVGDPTSTSVFTQLNIAGGASPTATLDLNKNGMVLDYTGASPLTTVAAQVASGYAASAWNGKGINSAAAAADPGGHAVGYAEASAIGSPATFLGQTIDNSAVLVRYTRIGDANLSGTTDIGDFSLLAANFNAGGSWVTGDFNYDGTTNIADFSLLAANFNLAAAGDLPRGAAVPEPATGGILAAAAILGRRRRRA